MLKGQSPRPLEGVVVIMPSPFSVSQPQLRVAPLLVMLTLASDDTGML